MQEIKKKDSNSGKNMVLVVYILYLLSVALSFVCFVGFIGLIIAYVNKNDMPEWAQSHYRFQIRTFWIGALYFSVSALLCVIIIGIPLLLLSVVWLIVRCIKGMKFSNKQQACPEQLITTWWL